MTQRPWLDYAGESADQLLALTDTHRIDSIAVAFETALGQKAFTLGADSLSVPERDVFAIEALEREVHNGGYGQFFANSSNEFAASILEALRRVGCEQVAIITERAFAALPPGISVTVASLDAEMAIPNPRRDDDLHACNQAYFDAPEDIAAELVRYLQRHREDLRLS